MARPARSKFPGPSSTSSDSGKQEPNGGGIAPLFRDERGRFILKGKISGKGLPDNDIEDVWQEATEVFGSREKAEHWLKRPSKALDSRTPLECGETPDGKAQVMGLLGRIAHGLGA